MKILVATVLALSLATIAYAKPIGFKSCTADEKPVVLKGEIVDEASTAIVKNIQDAFDNAAHQLSADDLQSAIRFRLFVSGLSDEAKAVFEIPEPPQVIEGSCKVGKKS